MTRPASGVICAWNGSEKKPVVVGIVVQDGQVTMLPPYARRMGVVEGPARAAWDLLVAAGWKVKWAEARPAGEC